VNSHEEILDDEGVDVTDLESARCQAFAAISELRHEYRDVIKDWANWRINIVTSDGILLDSIPLAETLH
jgi:hypothetical protein